MRSVILGLAAVLATLLVADAARADCRHAGAGFVRFNAGGGYYARGSALVVVRSAPVYAYAADPCVAPVPVDVPPLALQFRAADSYGYADRVLNFRSNSYGYGVTRNVVVERRVVVDRGVGRRAVGGNAGTGVVGIARAVLGTAGNVVRAVVGR